MNASPILDRVNATINVNTEAALAGLAGLELEITHEILQAEALAAHRIGEAVARIETLVADSLTASERIVAAMATNAVEGVVARLNARLGATVEAQPEPVAVTIDEDREAERTAALGGDLTQPITMQPEPLPVSPEPEAVQVAEEPVAEPQPVLLAEAAEESPEGEPIATVAAQMLAGDAVGWEREAEGQEGESEDGVLTVGTADGLHERRGRGRGTRYDLVESPEPGRVYWSRFGSSWRAVKFIPA